MNMTKSTPNLKKELEYYIENQMDLVQQYLGKYIVIKDQKVIGVYDMEIDAYFDTQKEHELGSFLIQHCTPGKESYTQTFHSRVYF
jgi:hypothetical protein